MGLHEWDVQCMYQHSGFLYFSHILTLRFVGVGEAEWAFKTTFNVTEKELASQNVDLVFDGLDTFANISLVRIPHQQEKCPTHHSY